MEGQNVNNLSVLQISDKPTYIVALEDHSGHISISRCRGGQEEWGVDRKGRMCSELIKVCTQQMTYAGHLQVKIQ